MRSASQLRRRSLLVTTASAVFLCMIFYFQVNTAPSPASTSTTASPAAASPLSSSLQWLLTMDDPYTVSTLLRKSGELPQSVICGRAHWKAHLAVTYLLEMISAYCAYSYLNPPSAGGAPPASSRTPELACHVVELGCVVGHSIIPLASVLDRQSTWYIVLPLDQSVEYRALVESQVQSSAISAVQFATMNHFENTLEVYAPKRYSSSTSTSSSSGRSQFAVQVHLDALPAKLLYRPFHVLLVNAGDWWTSRAVLEWLLLRRYLRGGAILVVSATTQATAAANAGLLRLYHSYLQSTFPRHNLTAAAATAADGDFVVGGGGGGGGGGRNRFRGYWRLLEDPGHDPK